MLMGVTEYAAHRGVELYAVQYAIARGRIRIGADNRIDSEEADRAWEANTLHTNARPGPRRHEQRTEPPTRPTEAEPGISYADARALREVFDAKRKQLELEVRQGTLVRRDEVEREAFSQFRMLRDACFNLPPRLAAQLAAESDPNVVHDLLEGELRLIFDDFAEGQPQ